MEIAHTNVQSFCLSANYIELFAPTCGSIGEFIVIKRSEDGKLAITPEMQNYSFSIRRLNGEFYAHVYPFHVKLFPESPRFLSTFTFGISFPSDPASISMRMSEWELSEVHDDCARHLPKPRSAQRRFLVSFRCD